MERLLDEQVQEEINESQTNLSPKLSIVTDSCRHEEDRNESLCASSIESENVNSHFYMNWLIKHLGQPLEMGLKNMVMRKPKDPVEYLALWLLNYQKNLKEEQLRMKSVKELTKLDALIRESNEAHSFVVQDHSTTSVEPVEQENEEEGEGEDNSRNWDVNDNKSEQY